MIIEQNEINLLCLSGSDTMTTREEVEQLKETIKKCKARLHQIIEKCKHEFEMCKLFGGVNDPKNTMLECKKCFFRMDTWYWHAEQVRNSELAAIAALQNNDESK